MVQKIVDRLNKLLGKDKLLMTQLLMQQVVLDDESPLRRSLFSHKQPAAWVTETPVAGNNVAIVSLTQEFPVLRFIGLLNYILRQHGISSVINMLWPTNQCLQKIVTTESVISAEAMEGPLHEVTAKSVVDVLLKLLESTPVALGFGLQQLCVTLTDREALGLGMDLRTHTGVLYTQVSWTDLLNYCLFDGGRDTVHVLYTHVDGMVIPVGFTARAECDEAPAEAPSEEAEEAAPPTDVEDRGPRYGRGHSFGVVESAVCGYWPGPIKIFRLATVVVTDQRTGARLSLLALFDESVLALIPGDTVRLSTMFGYPYPMVVAKVGQ